MLHKYHILNKLNKTWYGYDTLILFYKKPVYKKLGLNSPKKLRNSRAEMG